MYIPDTCQCFLVEGDVRVPGVFKIHSKVVHGTFRSGSPLYTEFISADSIVNQGGFFGLNDEIY
ncbi:MAG: hypothetical protein KAG93_05940 [Desulfuromusa sp.]|nr:hypothetical protein [Desulfuromusa sp.]